MECFRNKAKQCDNTMTMTSIEIKADVRVNYFKYLILVNLIAGNAIK